MFTKEEMTTYVEELFDTENVVSRERYEEIVREWYRQIPEDPNHVPLEELDIEGTYDDLLSSFKLFEEMGEEGKKLIEEMKRTTVDTYLAMYCS